MEREGREGVGVLYPTPRGAPRNLAPRWGLYPFVGWTRTDGVGFKKLFGVEKFWVRKMVLASKGFGFEQFWV